MAALLCLFLHYWYAVTSEYIYYNEINVLLLVYIAIFRGEIECAEEYWKKLTKCLTLSASG